MRCIRAIFLCNLFLRFSLAIEDFMCQDPVNKVMISSRAMYAKLIPTITRLSRKRYQIYKNLVKKNTYKQKVGLRRVWQKPIVTYALYTYPSEMSLNETRIAIASAFYQWSSIVPLTFEDITNTHVQPDIKIVFDYSPCKVYAFTVPGDKIFFNTKYKWAYADIFKIIGGKYMDLFMIALHEIGHQLGIADDMGKKGSVMNMFNWTPQQDEYGIHLRTRLQKDDIEHAQKIYGPRKFLFKKFMYK